MVVPTIGNLVVVHWVKRKVTGSGKTSQTLLPMTYSDMMSNSFTYEKVEVVQMGQIVLEPKGDFAKTFWTFGKLKERQLRTGYKRFILKSVGLLNEKIDELKEERKYWIDIRNGSPLERADQKEFDRLTRLMEDTKSYYKLSDDEQIEIESKYEHLRELKYGRELTFEEEGSFKLIEDGLKKLIYVRKNLPDYVPLTAKGLSDIETFALFQYAANLSYIIANPALADSAWKDIVSQDPHQKRDPILLFDPMSKNSPYFNPLYGPEDIAVGTVTSTLMAGNDSSEFFKNIGRVLLQNAIRVAKRVHGNDATLIHVNDILTNNGGRGETILKELGAMNAPVAQANENRDLRNYFLNDYYSAMKGQKNASKTYEQTSDVRNRVNNLLDNKRLRRVLCPPPGIGTGIDFDKILRTGDKVALSTQTGVSDELGAQLGSFLMLQLQDAISRRKGKENTRNPVIVYIDEFQDYANERFEDVLTKGRSYVVSMTMATQTLGIVEQKAGTALLRNLQSNARNLIVYPGGSKDDVAGFRDLFGQTDEVVEKRTISREVPKDLSPIDKARLELGLKEKPPAERESIGEDVKPVERFTMEQLMYGPNVTNRNINSNTAFGFIFYRLVIKNSIQVPSVAKIEYIPYELKKASDKLIQSYESILEKELRDEEEGITEETQTSNVDALGGAGEAIYQETTFADLNAGITRESDPSLLARDKSGSETDLSSPVSNTDTGDVELPVVDVSGVDVDGLAMPDLEPISGPPVDIPDSLQLDIELPDFGEIEI